MASLLHNNPHVQYMLTKAILSSLVLFFRSSLPFGEKMKVSLVGLLVFLRWSGVLSSSLPDGDDRPLTNRGETTEASPLLPFLDGGKGDGAVVGNVEDSGTPGLLVGIQEDHEKDQAKALPEVSKDDGGNSFRASALLRGGGLSHGVVSAHETHKQGQDVLAGKKRDQDLDLVAELNQDVPDQRDAAPLSYFNHSSMNSDSFGGRTPVADQELQLVEPRLLDIMSVLKQEAAEIDDLADIESLKTLSQEQREDRIMVLQAKVKKAVSLLDEVTLPGDPNFARTIQASKKHVNVSISTIETIV